MEFINKYVNIYTASNEYAPQYHTYSVEYEKSKNDSAKKTLIKIDDVISRNNFFTDYDLNELKTAANYLVTKYKKDKENFGIFRRILIALDNFLSPLLGRKTYEKELEELNDKIQASEE